MADDPGAVLIADVGSVTTRVTLVDTVAGETRLIGQGEAPTSAEPPYKDVLIGILEATVQIAERTERTLLREGRLAMPQDSQRDGVNHLVVTSSAAGTLGVIIIAIASDVSARSAQHAVCCTYTSLLQTITLDDTRSVNGTTQTSSWVERQVQAMLEHQPDVIVLAGGLESGAHEVLHRLAHIVAFGLTHMVGNQKSQRRDIQAFPVIYAGNSKARDGVIEALSGKAETLVVENLRPTLEEARLEGARRELTRLYDERIMQRLPGIDTLQKLSKAPISTACAVEGIMTRFLAERSEQDGRGVLSVNVGASSTSALLALPGRYSPAVLSNCGVGYGAVGVALERGLAQLSRWLPFSMSDDELMHWVLNKMLRPHVVPTTREDLMIEHALAREALLLAEGALADEMETLQYDMLLAGGRVLSAAPTPGLALLTLLDGLQPTGRDTTRALDVHLDEMGLLASCGALAGLDSAAALTLLERDLLNNRPLATCVVTLGAGKPGDVVLEAELAANRGDPQRVIVHHGELVRLPLRIGARATLTLRPMSGVRIGRNTPGEETVSDVGAIRGSELGVVIDARGRPLRLAADAEQRQQQIWRWLVALGAEQSRENPYLAAAGSAATPVEMALSQLGLDADAGIEGVEMDTGRRREPPAAAPEPAAPAAPAAEPASAAQRSKRISLEDLAQDASAPAEPAQRGKRISLEDIQNEPPPPSSGRQQGADTLQDDLADLRQTMQEDQEPPKKKRGWFGRGKS